MGVSACLLGREVRYDGQHKRDAFLVELLGPFVEWVPVCPEMEMGLGVPREPIRLVGRSGAPRLVGGRSGRDHTEAMRAYAEERVAALAEEDLSGYVTKKDSPSCGLEQVRVHGARGGPPRPAGVGAFARVLLEAMPLLPVVEEARLRDPSLRESFVERVFAFARWKAAVSGGMTRGRLAAFHAAHELALLAHSPAACRRLGALARGPGEGPRRDARISTLVQACQAADAYAARFMAALKVPATRVGHTRALRHAAGILRRALASPERRELEKLVSDHGRGLVPLVVPLTLLRHHVRKHGVEHLAGQVYLDPDPRELTLRRRA